MRITQYAAVQLFIARAQAAKADFAVTNSLGIRADFEGDIHTNGLGRLYTYVLPYEFFEPGDRHRDLDFSVEAIQNGHQPVNGEAAQVHTPYPGKIRRGNTCHTFRLPDGQLPFIQDVNNLSGQYGTQLLRIGIGMA
jgi:hypothetical protein